MNQRLDHVENWSAPSHADRDTCNRDWTRWNHLRRIVALAASVCHLGAALVRAGPDTRGVSLKIARADIAEFLNRQISDSGQLHCAIAISN